MTMLVTLVIRTAPCGVTMMMLVILVIRTAPDSIGKRRVLMIQNDGYSQCISIVIFPLFFFFSLHF